jgi:hypothetical protein
MINITSKKIFTYSAWMFAVTLLLTVAWNYFDPQEKIIDLFAKRKLVIRVAYAIFMGFVLTYWIKLEVDARKT